ncbi:uncharacterized protein LOC101884906, partial [Tachysurus ichikawai]
MLKEELELENVQEFFWTFFWRRFHVFIVNRIQHIKESTKPTQWKSVFSKDVKELQSQRELTTKDKASRLYRLNPFLDDKGILRVGGRLEHATLHPHIKHPVILPKTSYITKLLIDHYHQQVRHQGRDTYCGMDCFGPFHTKEGRKELKCYGLLFTCLCSRAVHIEFLDDLSADASLNSLLAFIALRGNICQLRSDQGTNSAGARREFLETVKEMVQECLKQLGCEFVMNPPSASHMGGAWERQIRTIRSVLTSILDQSSRTLDSSSLRTYLYELMAIVISRPITADLINDPTGPQPLTPNLILTMKSSIILPPPGAFVKESSFTFVEDGVECSI